MTWEAPRLYTAAGVRALDRDAIERQGIDGETLMARAGQLAFEAASQRFAGATRWAVWAGAGNNGGDAYVVARLARQHGIDVRVIALRPPEHLDGAAANAAQEWLSAGGEVAGPDAGMADANLIVDGLLGTGLDRDVEGSYRSAVESINAHPAPVVALDVPSGLSTDTGQVMGVAVRAALTATFVGRKRGLYTHDGPDHCGEVVFDALGTEAAENIGEEGRGELLTAASLDGALPRRALNSHKGSFGHVIVVGGQTGMGGAVQLAGVAALRAGAGSVTVATVPETAAGIPVGRPELMSWAVEDGDDLRDRLARKSVIAVGPGLGRSGWSRSVLAAALDGEQPLVIDADGLNGIETPLERSAPTVLTPHPGEAARLLEVATSDIQAHRFAAATEIASRHHAVVVLKGCGTVVSDPTGRYVVIGAGNPGMATAGSGDVLTGVVAAMLAQGLNGWNAACIGALAHAVAGDHAAALHGQRGLLAGDIAGALGGALDR